MVILYSPCRRLLISKTPSDYLIVFQSDSYLTKGLFCQVLFDWRHLRGNTTILPVLKYPKKNEISVQITMGGIESRIKDLLATRGITCQSVYRIPDQETKRILLAFNSQKNPRLTIRKIERILNETGSTEFKAAKDFHRLSATFLHLEVTLGARTEPTIAPSAQ